MNYKLQKSELSDELRDDIVFNSDKIARSTEVEIHGRTLVNLLGRAGNAIYGQSDLLNFKPTLLSGNFSITVGDTEVHHILTYNKLEVGKYYIGLFDCKSTANWGAKVQFSNLADWDYKKHDIFENVTGKWHTVYNAAYITDNQSDHTSVYFQLGWDKGINNIVRNIRLYEISKEVYEKINTHEEYTGEKLGDMYPYVDDIKCVVNPYIECKENFMDSTVFFKGGFDGNGNENPSIKAVSSSPINLTIGERFILSIEGEYANSNLPVQIYNTGHGSNDFICLSGEPFTYTAEKCIRVHIPLGYDETLVDKLYNSILKRKTRFVLTKGDSPKSYYECDNSSISFDTKLYEGEIISRKNDGSYVKNSEYGEELVDKLFPKKIINSSSGFKISEKVSLLPHDAIGLESYMVRYDGKIVEYKEVADISFEHWYIHGKVTKEVVFILPNTLTGWGDSYTPNEEEIKAFFLGWRMTPNDGESLYNDTTGVTNKTWVKLWCGIGTPIVPSNGLAPYIDDRSTWVTSCPTYKNDAGYIPYKIIYKKASSNIEKLKTRGSLSIKYGVSVNTGSGIVTDERINSYFYTAENCSHFINCGMEFTKYRVRNFLKIMKDDTEIEFYQRNITSLAMEQTITHGEGQAFILNRKNGQLSIDYLIYEPDTIHNYQYHIRQSENTKNSIHDVVENIGVCLDYTGKNTKELSKVKTELAQKSNPNLLINSNFRDVINQRGENKYYLSRKYTVDRWQYFTAVEKETDNITVNNGYITLNCESADNVYILQSFDTDIKNIINNSKWVTISLKYRSTMSFRVSINDEMSIIPPSSSWNTVHVPVQPTPGKSKSFMVQNYDGTKFVSGSVDIEWIKVEVGPYVTPFIPKPHVEEFNICQRYYQKLHMDVGRGYTHGAYSVLWRKTNGDMRVKPTAKLVGETFIFRVLNSQTNSYIDYTAENSNFRINLSTYPSYDYINFHLYTDNYSQPARGYQCILGHTKASNYLELDAEIY